MLWFSVDTDSVALGDTDSVALELFDKQTLLAELTLREEQAIPLLDDAVRAELHERTTMSVRAFPRARDSRSNFDSCKDFGSTYRGMLGSDS